MYYSMGHHLCVSFQLISDFSVGNVAPVHSQKLRGCCQFAKRYYRKLFQWMHGLLVLSPFRQSQVGQVPVRKTEGRELPGRCLLVFRKADVVTAGHLIRCRRAQRSLEYKRCSWNIMSKVHFRRDLSNGSFFTQQLVGCVERVFAFCSPFIYP